MRNNYNFYLLLLIRMIRILYNYKVNLFFKRVYCFVYSIWISYEFKKVGTHSYFQNNLTLIGGRYIIIGKNTSLGCNGILTAWDRHLNEKYTPRITIGDNCHIGDSFHISSINEILIGNNILTGRRISIVDNFHGESKREYLDIPPMERSLYTKGPIIIEDNVWIGDKVSIMSNVKIGKGSIIGANSVVTKSIPSYSVVGGIPARILKTLNL